MNNLTDSESITKIVRETLAEHLGVEIDDIKDEDFFDEDLHLNFAELSDFVESLEGKNIDTHKLEISEIETVGDLIEQLNSQPEIV
jgi:acyl carrier protein